MYKQNKGEKYEARFIFPYILTPSKGKHASYLLLK